MEEWKTTIENSNYEVSNKGNVRNKTTGKILKYCLCGVNRNYCMLRLGKGKKYSIHRLVANAFIPNDDELKNEIDHIDRNSLNNNVENLRWVTRKENAMNRDGKYISIINQYNKTYYHVQYRISYGISIRKTFKDNLEVNIFLDDLKKKYPRK